MIIINLQDVIEYRLQTERIIEDTWVAELEASNKLIIHIEDNGAPFLYKGSWNPTSPREAMIEKVKETALSEGISTTVYSPLSDKKHSSVFNFSDDHKVPVYASICLIPVQYGFMSVTLIQFRPNERAQIYKLLFLFIAFDILGTFALFLVSCFFVNKALEPAEENQKRQNEFIAAASHDLRSPLAVIQTNASAFY